MIAYSVSTLSPPGQLGSGKNRVGWFCFAPLVHLEAVVSSQVVRVSLLFSFPALGKEGNGTAPPAVRASQCFLLLLFPKVNLTFLERLGQSVCPSVCVRLSHLPYAPIHPLPCLVSTTSRTLGWALLFTGPETATVQSGWA